MSDYLWDKTGERDPEVERLEELLGGLRFAPGELKLPAAAAPRPARAPLTLFKWGALAAALALAALAGALVGWRGDGGRDAAPSVAASGSAGVSEAAGGAGGSQAAPSPSAREFSGAAVVGPPDKTSTGEVSNLSTTEAVIRPARVRPGIEASRRRRDRPRPKSAATNGDGRITTAADSAERRGIEAKEQLLYALRLTSAKLEEVRRRTQDAGDSPEATPARGRTR